MMIAVILLSCFLYKLKICIHCTLLLLIYRFELDVLVVPYFDLPHGASIYNNYTQNTYEPLVLFLLRWTETILCKR
jgi:hypothetical protein